MSSSNHTLILKNDGTLWSCGHNNYSQLGLGDTDDRTTFTQITTNTDDIKSVYCGGDHVFILKKDGTLWGCGFNGYGQLGLENGTSTTTFTQITINTDNIKSVYCGREHTIMLKNDGTLWGCGNNSNGQLGLGENTSNQATFTQIIANTDDIKSVYCGSFHTFILKNDGTLWGCGRNDHGQLGLGDNTNRNTFTQITTNIDDVKSVYCGGFHTTILKNDGTLWSCGYNSHGELGLGDNTDRNVFIRIINDVKLACCGYDYTFILKNDGTLWGCGRNSQGQLGLGDNINKTTFTKITINTNDVQSIYCGNYHVLILKNDGTLFGCGRNNYGQLGLGDTKDRKTFTQIIINTDDIKCLANDYSNIPNIIKIYDTEIGYVETLDTNNFRNISVNNFEKIKVLCTNPDNTYLNCLISFDKKQTWKTFNGTTWTTTSDTTPTNIILNSMQLKTLDKLDKNKLISGGFTGDLDFKIAMKTNDEKVTSSVTKIYIEYK